MSGTALRLRTSDPAAASHRPGLRRVLARGRRRAVGRAPWVVLPAVAVLVLGACGADDPDAPVDGPYGQTVADGLTLSGQWPLTGLPADGPAPSHPVIAVKIDNSSASSPQLGLGSADLVVEELVEGGATRLAVFYYSRLPKVTGPVRSMRATDVGIVQPAEAVVVASGGAPPTVRRMADADVRAVTEGDRGFFRDPGRTMPYDLMMRLPQLAGSLASTGTPDSYLPWGSADDFPGGRPAREVAAVFSPGHTTSWRFEGDSWTNLDGLAPEDDRFRPTTLLMLSVRVGDAGYLDPAGNPVPETVLAGSGPMAVFHDGRVVRGSWHKEGLAGDLRLSTQAGELTIPPGRVWIELVPARGGDVRIG